VKKGHAVLQKVRPVFEDAGAELQIIETEYTGHARELAQTLDLTDLTALCAIGGDGTLHEVVNGLLTRTDSQTVPIGLIPGGSGNSFMHTVDCLDPFEAARGIVEGRKRPVDVAEVTLDSRAVYACNIVGWGLATDILRRSEWYRWLGESRYTIASLVEVLKGKHRIARLEVEGEVIEGDFSFVLACNTKYTGKGMLMAPDAQLSDGLIDLVVVRSASRFEMLRLLPKIFDGSYLTSPKVTCRQVKEFTLTPEIKETVNVDGELMDQTPIHVTMLPGAVMVLV